MKALLKSYLLLIPCFVCLTAHAENSIFKEISDAIWGADQSESAVPAGFSTNWIQYAKAGLPTNYLSKELSFGDLTNLVCQESDRGNTAEQYLWGFALVAQNQSKEAVLSGMQLMRAAARKGYVPAMLSLGKFLVGDRYVERNYDEAFHWFSLAADKKSAEGQLQLGGCYEYGLGTTTNFPLAANLFRLSALQTNYVAMKSFGSVLMNGRGIDADVDEARYWFTRAAREGNNRRAMYDLGAICMKKFPDTNSTVEAYRWYRRSADLGDALGCFEVAKFYYNGWGGLEASAAENRYWLSRAAALGATEAQRFMGDVYRNGEGVAKNNAMALAWYQRAAAKKDPRAFYGMALTYLGETNKTRQTNEITPKLANDYMILAAQRGHREAQFQCAMNCFRGNGLPRDFDKGQQWLLKSAANGWGRAEFLLFQLYYGGDRPDPECPSYPKDQVQAVKWLRQAAEHENLQAQAVLAVMLIKGDGMEQNKAEAEKLLRHAAERGCEQAQNDLGFAILSGEMTNRDLVEAAMWCKLAESGAKEPKEFQRATVNFSNASLELSAGQQAEVDRRVKGFHALRVAQLDAMTPEWESNPDYLQEDGRFGH